MSVTSKKLHKMKKKIALLFSCLWLLVSCAEVPVTGRSQLRLVNNAELYALSFQAYNQFLQENRVVSNAPQAATVKSVGNKLRAAIETYMRQNNMSQVLEGYKWEFNLVEDKNINAFCMPGGKVVVFTGILPVTQDETGLAVVMGHEIAHAIAEHGNERTSQGLLANGLLQAGSIATQTNPKMAYQLALQAAGLGTQLGLLAYGRKQESEADEIGLIMMAMAGYDPRAAVPFWQRMAAQGNGQQPPEFLSTHPSSQTRISRLQKLMPKALEYYQGNGAAAAAGNK
jgi:predicted Zn-dependent protease